MSEEKKTFCVKIESKIVLGPKVDLLAAQRFTARIAEEIERFLRHSKAMIAKQDMIVNLEYDKPE